MKIATTKERILQFIDYKGISKQVFFKETGLKRGFLDADKLATSIPDTFIAIIIASYPEINPLWLLLGRGDMLVSGQLSTASQVISRSSEATVYYNMYKEKDEENKALIEQIGQLKERLRIQEEKIVGLQTIIASSSEDAQDADIAAVG